MRLPTARPLCGWLESPFCLYPHISKYNQDQTQPLICLFRIYYKNKQFCFYGQTLNGKKKNMTFLFSLNFFTPPPPSSFASAG